MHVAGFILLTAICFVRPVPVLTDFSAEPMEM